MKPTAVFVDLRELFYDQHGLHALTASLRDAGIGVGYLGTRSFRRALASLERLRPDYVLYSSFSADLPRYAAFDRLLKHRLRATSVIGGPGVTYGWQDLVACTIDALCLGEGEEALVRFIREGATDRNLFLRGQEPSGDYYPLADLDRLPFPDRSAVYRADPLLRDAPSKQFFSGRGCPYDCAYCFNHQFKRLFAGCGRLVRKKGLDYLLEEIRRVRRDYPLAGIVFNDDTFILDRRWFLEFSERFPREVGLPFTCNIRANLMDEEIARGLRESGCRGVNWSIESGSARLRNEVLHRGMREEQILTTADLLHRHGIPFRIGNMVGLPGETAEEMFQTVKLNIRCRPTLGLANIFVPYPGLDLTDYARRHGYLADLPVGSLPQDYFTTSVLNFTPGEKRLIFRLMCIFPLLVRHPPLFRRLRLRAFLLALPDFLLRVIYELVYTTGMARMYLVKTSLRLRLRMGLRYLRNL